MSTATQNSKIPAIGPLKVSKVNSRYFAVADGDTTKEKAIYLTGSHINNNFHDGLGAGAECAETPEHFDFNAYLAFLKDHNHNFIRFWRWELFRSQVGNGAFHFCATPQPWLRAGPGEAKDGKPKFDLSKFDQTYFDRLREHVVAAGREGIYVSVMLFEGFSLHLTPPPDNIEGHPFHAANNINDIGITSIVDYQVLPLDPRVKAFQEMYICKVIDTVHDLPNVLFEVANESSGEKADSVTLPDGTTYPTPIGDSTEWQYWVIDFIKRHERDKNYAAHPVGMTFQYPVHDQSKANDPLFASPADWISPGFDEGPTPSNSRWLTNPPVNDGTKVILSDTDHYSPFQADALWAWRSLLRGHNPLLYDFGIVDIAHPEQPLPGLPPYESYEPARRAMGDTLRFTQSLDLIKMKPRNELSSTEYVLANPGREYLVLQPNKGESFTVTLEAGQYKAEWCDIDNCLSFKADKVVVKKREAVKFTPPSVLAAAAVLHLWSAKY